MNLKIDLLRILPELILAGFAVLVMVLEPFVPARRKSLLGWTALFAVIAAGGALVQISVPSGPAFNRSFHSDSFSFYFTALFIAVAAVALLGSFDYLERERIQGGEFYALVLMATVGMCFMAASTNLVMVFLGLEISSLSTYILAGLKRRDAKSNEASLKYFLLGSFATAFFLYGVAFVYGLTGTVDLAELAGRLAAEAAGGTMAQVALVLMFVGLAFKVSTVPFQVWTPDVYQGAPAPVTALLSTGPKAAAFAVLLRVALSALGAESHLTMWLLWVSAVLTMSLGNLAALAQSNVKRMLGYSAIAHAGYVLVGIAAAVAGNEIEGAPAVLFYLAAYSLMNLGAFLLVAHLSGADERATEIGDFTGLGAARPGAAACLTILMLSLAGIPTTAGFLGKFYVFRAAVHAHLVGLTVIAVLNSVVSVYYYLGVVVAMYMREGGTEASTERIPWALRAAVAAAIVGIFYLGIFPNKFLFFTNLTDVAAIFGK